jgi:hypothetical protein
MQTIDDIVQEIIIKGRVTRVDASRRDIQKMLQAARKGKPVHRTPLPRFMQHTKEQPKNAVRNVTKGATPMPNAKRPAGQKMEPWNK